MSHETIYPYFHIQTLFENSDFLPKDIDDSELIANQLLINYSNILINFTVYRKGQVYILWWPLHSFNPINSENEIQSGYFDLDCIITNTAFTNDYFLFIDEEMNLKVFAIKNILEGPLIWELKKFILIPKMFLSHLTENLILFEEKGEVILLKLYADKKEDPIKFEKVIIESYQTENLYFFSKENKKVYSLTYFDKMEKLKVNFKLFAQNSPSDEAYFYHLKEYNHTDIKPDSFGCESVCSFSCEKPIMQVEVNTTGEKLLVKLLNGLIFLIENFLDKNSKVYYGKLKQIDNNFQLKWIDNLPLICCYGKGILIFLDNELNFLKSFRDKNVPLSSISFLTGFNFSHFEELPLFSYVKANNAITIRLLATKSENKIEHSNVAEELIYYFFEKCRLDLVVSMMKERKIKFSKSHEELELILLSQFEEYFPKTKDGAEQIIDYFSALEKYQDALDKTSLSIHRLILTFLGENDLESAYKLAKKTKNIIGLIKIKDYCQEKGFIHLHEKIDNQLNKILKNDFGISEQTLKELKHLKDIDSLDELLPFDAKLQSVLQTLKLSEKDVYEASS